MHVGGGAAPRVGLPDALGQQTDRRARFDRARARTDEPSQRARLANTAGLSVGPLIIYYRCAEPKLRPPTSLARRSLVRRRLESARHLLATP